MQPHTEPREEEDPDTAHMPEPEEPMPHRGCVPTVGATEFLLPMLLTINPDGGTTVSLPASHDQGPLCSSRSNGTAQDSFPADRWYPEGL